MKNYPDLSRASKADHLLFDLGYSYALLWKAEQVLRDIAQCGDYPVDVHELLEQMAALRAGRLQLRDEIYDNAEEAAEKGAV